MMRLTGRQARCIFVFKLDFKNLFTIGSIHLVYTHERMGRGSQKHILQEGERASILSKICAYIVGMTVSVNVLFAVSVSLFFELIVGIN